MQVWLFVTAASFGIVTDALIGVDILLGTKQVLLRERGQLETFAIVFVFIRCRSKFALPFALGIATREVDFQRTKK